MITWTQSAAGRLEQYFQQLRPTLRANGADPDEVIDDLRRRIDQELATRQIEVVTAIDLERVLDLIGRDEAFSPDSRLEARPQDRPPRPPSASPRKIHAAWLFPAVVLPTAALVIELLTRMCSATFFDPLPTIWHVLLVAFVPAANLAVWLAIRRNGLSRAQLTRLGWANAFALGVSAVYSVLYLPLLPPAVFALVVMGWGLLPMSPLFAFVATWRLRAHLRAAHLPPDHRSLPGLVPGLALAAAVLLLSAAPIVATRYWEQMAAHDEDGSRAKAVGWLRSFGDTDTLLQDCYGRSSNGPWNDGWGLLEPQIPVETARELFYAVTGNPFNSVPPPQHATGNRAWSWVNEFDWDAEAGGTMVGGRRKDLLLQSSRLDALTDPDAAWSYTEWTLEFKNNAIRAQEARAQVALPPGGFVSRVTLWVNGEEREAAFAGAGKVREAYQQVVRVQRRDPILVTSCGPDRVLLQCFPVPANGGLMKVRIGVTAPLTLPSASEAIVSWPQFLERNFALPATTRHSLWLQSRQPLLSNSQRLISDRSKPEVHTLHGELTDAELCRGQGAVRARRSPSDELFWVNDPHSSEGQIIHQALRAKPNTPPERIVVVIDGSSSMHEYRPQILAALDRIPMGTDFAVLVAEETVNDLTGGMQSASRQATDSVRARLNRVRFVGGRDNLPALVRAWDLAAQSGSGSILWIHGPQPVAFTTSNTLKQRLDWNPRGGPVVHDFQVSTGPNRTAEMLSTLTTFRSAGRIGTLDEDLQDLFRKWEKSGTTLELARSRTESGLVPVINRGKEGSRHLARLWAFEEVQRLIAMRKQDSAVALAALYQLVTPVSGAVVLETQAQYAAADLQPVGQDTVPTVPEPSTLLCLLLGAMVLWAYRARAGSSLARCGLAALSRWGSRLRKND